MKLKNLKLYPSIHKMVNNRNTYNIDFKSTPFRLEEKIDGSNISIFKLNGTLHIYSRTMNITDNLGSISSLSDFIGMYTSVLLKFLKEGEILNGEWLASGRVKYEKIKLVDLSPQYRFVIFNLGKLKDLTIKELQGTLSDEEKILVGELGKRSDVSKVDFYNYEDVYDRFEKNHFFDYNTTLMHRSLQFKLEPKDTGFLVYAYSYTEEFLGSTLDGSFENWLRSHHVYSKSALFPDAEEIEGIVFKNEDSSVMIKYVMSTYSNQRKKPRPPKVPQGTPLTEDQQEWINEKVFDEGRFDKFLQHISMTSATFLGQHPTEIKKMINENINLIGNVFGFVMWLYDDIVKEEYVEDQWFTDKGQKRVIKKYLIEIIRNTILEEK